MHTRFIIAALTLLALGAGTHNGWSAATDATGDEPLTHTWANPKTALDHDGDGIADSIEVAGYPFNGSTITLDPNRKDLLILLIPYGTGADYLSNYPSAASLTLLLNMFDQAPLTGRDTSLANAGVKMQVLIPYYNYLAAKPAATAAIGSFDAFGNYDWTEFDAVKAGVVSAAGLSSSKVIYHTCLSCYSYGGSLSSGISRNRGGSIAQFRKGATDFILSLQNFQSQAGQATATAGTIAHELGHNLGLTHGGYDHINYKPNYVSIMNYAFQFDGVTKDGVTAINYSSVKMKGLNEKAVRENLGLGSAAAGFTTIVSYDNGMGGSTDVTKSNLDQPIDWNLSGTITSGAYGFSLNRRYDSKLSNLISENNWKNVTFKGGGRIGLVAGAELPSPLGRAKRNDPLAQPRFTPATPELVCPPLPRQDATQAQSNAVKSQDMLKNCKPLKVTRSGDMLIYSL